MIFCNIDAIDLFTIWGKRLGRARPILKALALVGVGESPPLKGDLKRKFLLIQINGTVE